MKNNLIDDIARAMWSQDSVRAGGKRRTKQDWLTLITSAEQEKWREFAKEAIIVIRVHLENQIKSTFDIDKEL